MAMTCGNCGKSVEDHAHKDESCKCILFLKTKIMDKAEEIAEKIFSEALENAKRYGANGLSRSLVNDWEHYLKEYKDLSLKEAISEILKEMDKLDKGNEDAIVAYSVCFQILNSKING